MTVTDNVKVRSQHRQHGPYLPPPSPSPTAARGHSELVQMLVEAAVMCDGVEKAKRNCIDHTNNKRQTALIVACKHG